MSLTLILQISNQLYIVVSEICLNIYLSLALLQERLSISFCTLVSVLTFDRLSFPLRDVLSVDDLALTDPELLCLVIFRLVCEPVEHTLPQV